NPRVKAALHDVIRAIHAYPLDANDARSALEVVVNACLLYWRRVPIGSEVNRHARHAERLNNRVSVRSVVTALRVALKHALGVILNHEHNTDTGSLERLSLSRSQILAVVIVSRVVGNVAAHKLDAIRP